MDKQADQQRGHIPTVPQQHGFFRRHLVRMVRAVLRRPARLVIGLVVAAACFGFLFNALVLQGGRHPAPLFTQWGRVTEDPLPALNRLGFGPIQPDGVMGLATQQAIDRFANARKWGKQDGISRRLIAELSEATGLKPE